MRMLQHSQLVGKRQFGGHLRQHFTITRTHPNLQSVLLLPEFEHNRLAGDSRVLG